MSGACDLCMQGPSAHKAPCLVNTQLSHTDRPWHIKLSGRRTEVLHDATYPGHAEESNSLTENRMVAGGWEDR